MSVIFSEQVILGGCSAPLSIVPALIEIKHGTIQKITQCSRSEITTLTAETVEDLGSAIVSPAFVNAHTHLAMLAFRGIGGQQSLSHNVVKDLYFRLEESLSAEDVRAFSRLGAVEAMMTGVGTVWEHYYYGHALVEALEDVGLCAAVASTLQDISGPGKDRTEKAFIETLDLASDSKRTEKGIVAVLGPHATDTVSDELWLKIATLAEEHHLPIHSHLAQALDETEWSLNHHNCLPLTRMHQLGLTQLSVPRLWVHGLFIQDDELDSLDKNRDHLGHCPSAQMQFGFPAYTHSWRNRNLKIVLGTDAASCNDGIHLQSELKFYGSADSYSVTMGEPLAKFRKQGTLRRARDVQAERQLIFDMRAPHILPENLLKTIWGNAGDLHPALPVGAIEVGRLANIVVWDPSHPCLWPNWDVLQGLSTSNATPAIQRIMLRGEWKFDGEGYLHSRISVSPLVQEWRKEADMAWHALVKRAGLS